MWVFTTEGFFSVVQKPGESVLTVRSRARDDLDRLRDTHLPTLGPTIDEAGTDYPYRARVPRADFAIAMLEASRAIDYSSFKNAVAAQMGSERAHVYHDVWQALLKLEKAHSKSQPKPQPKSQSKSEPRSTPRRPSPSPARSGKRAAFGGVVVDAEGRVLLREPADHFGGYVWTFPKGRPDANESP